MLLKVTNIRKMIGRFPLSSIASVSLFFIASVVILENSEYMTEEFYRFTMFFITLFLLGMSTQIWYESSGLSKKNRVFVWLVALGISFGHFFLIPVEFEDNFSNAILTRDILWQVALLLSIFFAPFLMKNRDLSNKKVYEYMYNAVYYIVLGFIISIIVFALGSLLLVSLDELFDLSFGNYGEEGYLILWTFCATVVGPWFVLSNLPRLNFNAEGEDMKLFGLVEILFKFIIIPFTMVYFIILYAYTGKILITWEWPEGMVSWFIVIFSIVGLISYFAVFLWKEKSLIFKVFSVVFPWSMLFQLIVLFIALWWRVGDYGITINRYLVASFGVWLAIIFFYIIFSRKFKIIVAPISLFVIIFISTLGPLSAMNVSKISQVNRFESFVEKYELVEKRGSKEDFIRDDISNEKRKEIMSVVRYLTENYGLELWEGDFPGLVNLVYENDILNHSDCSENDCSSWEFNNELEGLLGVGYSYSDNYMSNSDEMFNFSAPYDYKNREKWIDVKDGDIYINRFSCIIDSGCGDDEINFTYEGIEYEIFGSDKENAIIISESDTILGSFYYNDIAQKIVDAKLDHKLIESDFKFDFENDNVKLKFKVNSVRGKYEDSKVESVERLSLNDVLIKIK